VEFRNLFIEHTRIVDLKKQMVEYSHLFGADVKKTVVSDASMAYRNFRVLPYRKGEEKLTKANGKEWFKKRLKRISDRFMDFSDDMAWREGIQKWGKNRKFVLNEKFDQQED
jgi:hypothetical protein